MKIIKRTFTLIELLVVIVIIAILMGILLPVVQSVRINAKKAKAKAECNAIVTAIKQYEATYGYLPVNPTYTPTDEDNYRQLIEMLTGYDGPDASTSINGGSCGNPRDLRLLDVPSTYSTDDTARSGMPAGADAPGALGDYVDPWGSRYMIYVDGNYDGQVSVYGSNLNGSVFVYSLGPDCKHNTGSSTNEDNKDNICSWK